MTREQVSQTLMYMERVRMDSYEAESAKEKLRLTREYRRLWQSIEPYVTGREPYTAEPPPAEPGSR